MAHTKIHALAEMAAEDLYLREPADVRRWLQFIAKGRLKPNVALLVLRGLSAWWDSYCADAEARRLAKGWRKHIEVFERVERWDEGNPVLEIMADE